MATSGTGSSVDSALAKMEAAQADQLAFMTGMEQMAAKYEPMKKATTQSKQGWEGLRQA